jgi:hypothetical protein
VADTNGTHGTVPWNLKLLEPFTPDLIGLRPQVWCPDCRKSQAKYCGKTINDLEHVVRKCPDCHQKLSTAHLHLYFVGHADLTRRLLDVDPRWTWRPMYREVNVDILKAAIATQNVAIIHLVMDSFPPKLTTFEVPDGKGGTRTEHGMWIELILHDENGEEIVTPGFGDALGKQWDGNAMKEVIGDAARNAAMRRGAALDLWRKMDMDRAQKETRSQMPPSATTLAADLFADADGQAAASSPPPAQVNPEAQAFADLAWTIWTASQPDGDLAKALRDLKDQVYAKAAAKRMLPLTVHPPWAEDPAARVRVAEAVTHVKNLIDLAARQAKAAAETTPAGG